MSADFWAGYISGAAGIIIGNPLDLIKTRLQAAQSSLDSPSPQSLRSIFDRAGTLVKGATAPILGYGALNAILFTTYNKTLTLIHSPNPPTSPLTLPKIWLAGAIGGLATFLVSAPTELIKCRTQLSSTNTTSLSILRTIVRNDGVRGLYFGGGVTSVRDAIGYGFYFWSYEICKRTMNISTTPSPGSVNAAEQGGKGGEEGFAMKNGAKVLLAGGIAGIVTWASIFPLDVIKTRVQTQPFTPTATGPGTAGPPPSPPTSNQALLRPPPPAPTFRRKGAIEIARTAYLTDGYSVFFRGLGICSARAFIVNAVQWAVYEYMMGVLRTAS